MEQGTAGRTLCREGAAAKPLCQGPKLLKDAGLPGYWEALKGGDGGLGVRDSPLQDLENYQEHAICSTASHQENPQCHLHSHRAPPSLHKATIHHAATASTHRVLQALSIPPGKLPSLSQWKVLPRKCCSVLWVPTPAVSGLQSPSLLSQSVPHGTHKPFPDHHGTSGHPETCPGLSNPPTEDRTIPVTIFLGRDGSNRQRAAPATLAHPGAHQQQFISSCGSRFFHFFH